MRDKINEVLAKYYDSTQEYYFENREIDGEEDILIKDELTELLDELGAKYKIEQVKTFRSVGYDSDMLILSWIENDEIQLITVLLESF